MVRRQTQAVAQRLEDELGNERFSFIDTSHLLVQIRARVLNDQLADDFHRWYPNFTRAPDTTVKALAA